MSKRRLFDRLVCNSCIYQGNSYCWRVADTIFGVAVIRHWFSMVVCLQSIIVIVSGNSRAGKKLKTEKIFGKSVLG